MLFLEKVIIGIYLFLFLFLYVSLSFLNIEKIVIENCMILFIQIPENIIEMENGRIA